MPLSFDITQPASGAEVGTSVGVVGSFSGAAGNPFDMTCKIKPSSGSGHEDTQPGNVNVQAGTWQCTFAAVPPGTYDISAQVKPGLPQANPVTQVVVKSNQPIGLDPPGDLLLAAPAPNPNGKVHTLPLRGTTATGYGLADGYVVYCYLVLAGSQVSSGGRLTAFHPTATGHAWGYQLYLPTWAWSDAATLLVQLWKVGGLKPDSKPTATISHPIRVKG